MEWSAIAHQTKQAAQWTCQQCHIQQREETNNPITVHHQDHNIFNNNPPNLIVLCARCHLRIEGSYHRHQRYIAFLNHLQTTGQQMLPGFNPYPIIE